MSAASRPYGAFADAVFDALYRQLLTLEARREAAEAAMQMAKQIGNDDAWDDAAGVYDEFSDEIADIENRLFELENDSARAELRELRSSYYSSI